MVYITEGLIRRPQRSWQDRIPDTHLSNEERETIREHEDPVHCHLKSQRKDISLKVRLNINW